MNILWFSIFPMKQTEKTKNEWKMSTIKNECMEKNCWICNFFSAISSLNIFSFFLGFYGVKMLITNIDIIDFQSYFEYL